MKNSGKVLSILGFVVSGIGALAGIAGGIISGKKQSIEINNAVALKEYMTKARNSLLKDDADPALFVNVNGKRLTRQGFWKIVKYYK